MMAWMNAETLRIEPRAGSHRVLVAGHARRCGARATPRATVSSSAAPTTTATATRLLFKVEQEGKGACHTGEYSCFFRAFGA
jgi:phosphoribosyl-AMP cyclohydrolase